jgi:hypothetical protein
MQEKPTSGNQQQNPGESQVGRIKAWVWIEQEARPYETSKEGGQYTQCSADVPRSRKAFIAPEWITALATIGILIATAVYAGYAKRQWETMQGQMEAAKVSADAARVSAETAQQGLNLSVRPGIEMSDFMLSSFVVGQEARMDFNVMNVGPGRARGISIGGLLLLCPDKAVSSCLISCPRIPEPEPSPKMELEPGAKKGITRTQGTISEQQVNMLSSGSFALYFCGVVTCKDILLNPWDFPFCSTYDQKEKRWAYCPG